MKNVYLIALLMTVGASCGASTGQELKPIQKEVSRITPVARTVGWIGAEIGLGIATATTRGLSNRYLCKTINETLKCNLRPYYIMLANFICSELLRHSLAKQIRADRSAQEAEQTESESEKSKTMLQQLRCMIPSVSFITSATLSIIDALPFLPFPPNDGGMDEGD